ncbi:MAG: DUF177 domain-containing protein [Dehalococcoidales bacterium]|nr:MAG: DUF177 domain-containing protein [Dehalococcoidales bacterium]
MVRVNVAQLLKSPIGTVRVYDVSDNVDIGGSDYLVEGEVTLMRTNRSVLVEGELYTDIELSCSRCLSPFGCPITINIEEEYFPTTDILTGSLLPLPGEPGSFTIDELNILDLSEAIRQYALLTIPMKPLCRQDCAGLCPVCGSNLNHMSCNCPSESIDPRWAGLYKLVVSNNQPLGNEEKGTK